MIKNRIYEDKSGGYAIGNESLAPIIPNMKKITFGGVKFYILNDLHDKAVKHKEIYKEIEHTVLKHLNNEK